MSALMRAEGDLARMAANPPSGWGQKESAEEIALKAFAARKEAEQLHAQVKNEIVGTYGVMAWEQIQREIAKIRKEQKEAARKEAEEKAEQIKMLLWAVPFVGIPFVVLIIIAIAIIRSN
jgi:hypothetical protein